MAANAGHNTSPTEIPGGVLHQNVTSGTEQSITLLTLNKKRASQCLLHPLDGGLTHWIVCHLAAAAEGQNDVLASLAATTLGYRQEAHFPRGKTLLEITRPLQRIAPQVLIGYTEVAARRHVTKHVTST